MPKHKNKMKMPKHKMKMMPSNFDHSFSNKRSMGILPAGSISQNLLSSTSSPTLPPTKWCLKQHQQHNKLKLLVRHGNFSCPLVSLLSTEEEEEKDDTHTFCASDFGCPVDSCHEWVLVLDYDSDDDGEELALYNPTTKDKRTLPRPLRPPPSANAECLVYFRGLGLDPKSNDDDYKVIRYLEFEYDDDNYHTAAGFMGYKVVELYSLKTDSWKQIPYPHTDCVMPLFQPIYINGFHYWTAPSGPQEEDLFIVSFDFAKESFSSALIPGPPNEAYKFHFCGRHQFLLAEYEGSLALVVHDEHEKQIELWVWNFDNHSWRSAGVWALGVDVFRPLAFLKNRFFYFQDSNGELGLFDCATQKLKCIHGFCAVQPLFPLIVLPFLKKEIP